MVYLTHVYSTGRMDIEMTDTPFCLKISFRGEDATRWASIRYTMMAAAVWKVSDSFDKPMSIREKIDGIRKLIENPPELRFDAGINSIRANIGSNISIPMAKIVITPRLNDIAEESDDSWSDASVELDPPKFIIAACREIHTRCQDDIYEIADLMRKIQTLHDENDFLRSLVFRH